MHLSALLQFAFPLTVLLGSINPFSRNLSPQFEIFTYNILPNMLA